MVGGAGSSHSGGGVVSMCVFSGQLVEIVSDFILLGSKITADGDCSHEIKRRLPLGRKVMTNLDSILKCFANKGPHNQSYGFPGSQVWM